MSYRKERFRIRFRELSEQALKDIRCALPEAEAIQRGRIFGLEIHEGMNLEHLYGVLETLQLGAGQFEIIASVVTTSDNGGIDLPAYVMELIRRTNCGVGFSFVNTGPPDDAEDELEAPLRTALQ